MIFSSGPLCIIDLVGCIFYPHEISTTKKWAHAKIETPSILTNVGFWHCYTNMMSALLGPFQNPSGDRRSVLLAVKQDGEVAW